ncbi:MAG: hydrogenase maturation protease [Bacteroidales bacterium]|nr:hydrogenase maturation protease [Bacteroidales bacterium]
MKGKKRIFVYGYGNPGRQDDGLGVRCTELLEEWVKEKSLNNVRFDSNYQLNIEDAAEISNSDIVIFIDASMEEIKDFYISKLDMSAKMDFTMHSVSPGFVLHLCNEIYDRKPEAYLVHIKGYEWELKEGITEKAEKNLLYAFELLKNMVKYPDLIDEYIEPVSTKEALNYN